MKFDLKTINGYAYETGFILLGTGFVLNWLTNYEWTKTMLGISGLLLMASVVMHLAETFKTKKTEQED